MGVAFQIIAGLLASLGAGLLGLRFWDARADRAALARLLATQPAEPAGFDPAMVSDLPDPVRRYFLFTIAPGTPLRTVAEIEMAGELGFGTQAAPGYRPMRARQVLAAPRGFVWQVKTGIASGTDAATPDSSWSRFRLFGLIPVGRAGGGRDHARSSFGRFIAEAVFWTPAALLPGSGVTWTALSADTAQVQVVRGDLSQTVEIRFAEGGQPLSVRLDRWTNANPDKTYRLQPFGGDLSRFRDFAGFRLPTRIEGGNFYGTEAYFPFYRADVRAIRFPPAR